MQQPVELAVVSRRQWRVTSSGPDDLVSNSAWVSDSSSNPAMIGWQPPLFRTAFAATENLQPEAVITGHDEVMM
jgi:hypothetical protein